MFCPIESSDINIYFGCTSGRNVETVMFLLKANVSFLKKSLASAWFDVTVGALELLTVVPHEGDTSCCSVDEVPSQRPVMFCGHLTLRVHCKNLMRETIMMHYGSMMAIN